METINVLPGQISIIADAPVQMSFLSLIHESLDKLSMLKENKKMEKERLESELMQSEAYVQATEESKTAAQRKKATKEQIMRSPICAEIAEKIESLNEDMKLEKATLAHGAFNYQKETGEESINRNGAKYQLVKSVRLKKLKEKKRSS